MSCRILSALGLALLVATLTGCERERPDEAAHARAVCIAACTRAAVADGVDPGLCPPACSRTCAERCGDFVTRLGDFAPCQEVCSRSCADLEATFGMSHELCTYLVENRFDPAHVRAPDR